jgi:hypothetical protein
VNPRPSSTSPASSTSTTAAGWTLPSSGWPRPTGRATSTCRASAPAWPAPGLHQHQPERQEGGLRGHLHGGESGGGGARRWPRHPGGRAGLEVCP